MKKVILKPITYEEVMKLSDKKYKKFRKGLGKFDLRSSIVANEFTIQAMLDLINERLEKIHGKAK